MDRASFIRFGMRMALAVQLCGSSLVDRREWEDESDDRAMTSDVTMEQVLADHMGDMMVLQASSESDLMDRLFGVPTI